MVDGQIMARSVSGASVPHRVAAGPSSGHRPARAPTRHHSMEESNARAPPQIQNPETATPTNVQVNPFISYEKCTCK
jgi:hypothetical protein